MEYSKQDLKLNGVYKITVSDKPGKCYIGSTFNARGFIRRWQKHLLDLKKNVHHNKYLQNLYNKYGESSFKFEIVEIIPREEVMRILDREEYYIKYYDSYKSGFNLSEFADDSKRILQVIRKMRIPVLQYDSEGVFIKEWESISEVKKLCKSTLQRVIKDGGLACGYQWRFKTNNYPLNIGKYYYLQSYRILCYKMDGSFFKEYLSILDASKDLNIDTGSISRNVNGKTRHCRKLIFKLYSENYPTQITPVCRQHSLQSPLKITNIVTGGVFIFYSYTEAKKHGFNHFTIVKSWDTNLPFKCRKYNNQKFTCEKISYEDYLNYKYEKN